MRTGKRIGAAALALGLALAFAAPAPAAAEGQDARKQGTFELFLGPYAVSDPLFKEVYSQGANTVRGIILSSSIVAGIDFYAQIKALYKTGALTYTQEETKFLMIPLSLGLRYEFPTSYVIPYFGGGADFYFYYESSTIGTTMNVVTGTHVLGGLYIEFGKGFPVRLNGMLKYTWVNATESGQTIKLGGLEYGGGVAFVF
jgi:hypothetical protein